MGQGMSSSPLMVDDALFVCLFVVSMLWPLIVVGLDCDCDGCSNTTVTNLHWSTIQRSKKRGGFLFLPSVGERDQRHNIFCFKFQHKSGEEIRPCHWSTLAWERTQDGLETVLRPSEENICHRGWSTCMVHFHAFRLLFVGWLVTTRG